ncbi:MAG: hypothetical protein JWN33_240 [Candidatus Saccharibacteria bacterium]|nr:hypothetical protein [Candidatus Saccharibacteria bacterium]
MQQTAHRRKKAKGMPKTSTIAIYASAFVLLVVLVAIGYRPPQEAAKVATVTNTETAAALEPTSVNEVVATTVAANVAQATNLSIADRVSDMSVSAQIKNELEQSDDAAISKPDIVQPSASSDAITSYAVIAGDTTDSVAAKFRISKQTLKWANNLTSDNLIVGTQLAVPSTNGVLYTVKASDTIESLAKKYNSDATRIVTVNNLELSGLQAGGKIILPEGVLPETERPGYVPPAPVYVAPTITYASGGIGGDVRFLYWNTRATSSGNTMSWGNCTWYAWERRQDIGRPLPYNTRLGNAAEWAYSLSRLGYQVVYGVPAVGSIMQNGGGLGHVAIVESIAPNGDITVTEMNYGSWYNGVDQRTISAGQAAAYNYIY